MAEDKFEPKPKCLMIEEFESINKRIDELKTVIEEYLTLSNEFARASLVTTLKKI